MGGLPRSESSERLVLNEAQRRAIGVRLESMKRLLGELRLAGFESEKMSEIEEVMREVGSQTAAIVPEPPRNAVQAALAQLWVRVLEIRSRQLRQYGHVDACAAASLDAHSKRLDELVTGLVDEYERRRSRV